jgi:hypothetical protein
MLILRCNVQISCKSGKIITFNYVNEIIVNKKWDSIQFANTLNSGY